MTLARVKALGWAFGETLTSGQMTQVDINAARGIDSAGGTYTVPAALVLNGTTWDIDGSIIMGVGTHHIEQGLNFKTGAAASTAWRASTINASGFIDTSYDYYEMQAILAPIVVVIRYPTTAVPGLELHIDRWANPSAFTVTVEREDSTVLAVFAASQKAYARFRFTPAAVWVPSAWGGGVTV